jgi:FkbM family methyltransferase
MLRSYISRLSSHVPWLFYTLKKIDLLTHHLLHRLHEPEFRALAHLHPKSAQLLIVDIGANIGQSALDFSGLFPKAQIISFEANPQLAVFLRHCRRLIGERFEFRMIGMSDCPKKLTLFVPRRGNVHIYGEASVDPTIFDDASVQQRIGDFSLSRIVSDLIDFDSTGLRPDIVKIDVQGHELQVLRGMKQTLSLHRPYFFIERSPADADVMAFLQPFGYGFFVSGPNNMPVHYSGKSPCVNLICAPSEIVPVNSAA